MIASLALALLQVGPSTTGLPLEPLPIPRGKPQPEAQQPAPPPVDPRLAQCFAETKRDAAAGRAMAQAWLVDGTHPAEANRCLGVALASLGEWDAASRAFLAARDAGAQPAVSRARLGALAGNAALAAGNDEAALAALEAAQADALLADNGKLAASIGLDLATALVGLEREQEAMAALGRARAADPENGQAWLLSATLSRRLDNLVLAQQQIVEAARLLPRDPLVGLEAGVIAMLAGSEDAARKSWQSVIELAPDSDAATTARDYLAQLETP